jgi:hypothetical protein
VYGATTPEEARDLADMWTKNSMQVFITSKSNGVANKAIINSFPLTLNAQ